jgi:hypothetical protein
VSAGGGDQLRGISACGAFGGADQLSGGPGNDSIYHDKVTLFEETTASDGAKDLINCGPGHDRAFINTSVDGDVAINCEMVFKG